MDVFEWRLDSQQQLLLSQKQIPVHYSAMNRISLLGIKGSSKQPEEDYSC